jgi:hypothetical protein
VVNHGRTLLLNQAANAVTPGSFPGEAYIAPTFRPKTWPGHLNRVRRILFGDDPDRPMLNYRIGQYLHVLHASELESSLLALDSRITYRPGESLWTPTMFQPQVSVSDLIRTTYGIGYCGLAVTDYAGLTVEEYAGLVDGDCGDANIGEADFFWLGSPDAPDPTGRMYHEFTVKVLSASTVQVIRHSNPRQEVEYPYELTNGLSSPAPLFGSGYFFKTRGDVGARWRVTVLNRPQRDLSAIVAELHKLPGETRRYLFGRGKTEPWATWRELFEQHPETPYQLGGLLLSVLYRAEELN